MVAATFIKYFFTVLKIVITQKPLTTEAPSSYVQSLFAFLVHITLISFPPLSQHTVVLCSLTHANMYSLNDISPM